MPLNEKELGIAKAVVHQFLTSKEAMQRRPLHTQFKSAETLERLVRWSVLRSHDGFQTFFPAVLAFHYCGGEIELRARQSVEALAYVLKNLYEVELSRLNFKTEEIIAHAKKMYNGDGTTGANATALTVDPELIKLGLYLGQEFRLLSGWGGTAEILTAQISENVCEWEDEDIQTLWEKFVTSRTEFIEREKQEGKLPASGGGISDAEPRPSQQTLGLLREILEEMQPEDIYSADENNKFWKDILFRFGVSVDFIETASTYNFRWTDIIPDLFAGKFGNKNSYFSNVMQAHKCSEAVVLPANLDSQGLVF